MHWIIEAALALNVVGLVVALTHARRETRYLSARLTRFEGRLPAYGEMDLLKRRIDHWEAGEVARIKRLRDAEVASCRARVMAQENRERVERLARAGRGPRRLGEAEEPTILMRLAGPAEWG